MSKRSGLKLKKEIKIFWTASSLAVCFLLGGAVWQLNGFIHESSLLKDCQKQIALISSENDQLQAELSQSNSLENFNEYEIAQAGNYEKVDIASVRYIGASGNEFARK